MSSGLNGRRIGLSGRDTRLSGRAEATPSLPFLPQTLLDVSTRAGCEALFHTQPAQLEQWQREKREEPPLLEVCSLLGNQGTNQRL